MPASTPPETNGLLETSLYVEDLERSARFYETMFGFERIDSAGSRLIAMKAADKQTLLLFRKGASPDHDGTGQLHLAFAIGADRLASWREWLAANGLAIEEEREWPRGGTSLYFRDPDGHLLEVATPGVWSIY